MFQANLIPPEQAVMPAHPNSIATRSILAAIEQGGGAITYERFMELSLYGRGLAAAGRGIGDEAEETANYGFYSSGLAQVGSGEGPQDFTTHTANPAFGMSIAHYSQDVWARTGASPNFTVVEMGAGDGSQALSFLPEVNRQAALSTPGAGRSFGAFQNALRYCILEYGKGMIDKQRARLVGMGVSWVHGSAINLPLGPRPHQGETPAPMLLESTELPDTFPVSLVVKKGSGFKSTLQEVYVCPTKQGALYEALGPLSSDTLARQAHRADGRYPMDQGTMRVFNLRAQRWARSMGQIFQTRKGGILLIDYGNPGEVMDLPPRIYHRSIKAPYATEDKLQFMKRLQYELPGEVDITTSVAFGALQNSLQSYGLKKHYAGPETAFLDSYGFKAHAEHAGTPRPRSWDSAARSFMAYSFIKQ